MQLKNNKKIPLVVSAAVTAIVSLSHAENSTDTIEINHEYYSESDDRIDVKYTMIDFKKDFGTDWSFAASFSVDEITGGTPIWDSISAPSPCTDESGNYVCDDPEQRPGNLIGSPQADLSDFTYRNIEMVDKRYAGNASLTYRTTPERNEWAIGFAYSEEDDFKSTELSAGYLHYLDEMKNSSLSFGVSKQKNESYFYFDEEWMDMDITSIEVAYTQIFTPKTLGKIAFFRTWQEGALTNPYQTVIRRVNITEDEQGAAPIYRYYRAREIRPDKKNISGIALSLISELHDDWKLHVGYRLYKDDWDILSHTLDFKAYYSVTENLTIVPNIRYYNQSRANFYKGHKENDFIFSEREGYATSDERLGDFDSLTYAVGVEYTISDKWDANIHIAKQKTSYDLKSYWISAGVKYAF
ncbi:MAG: DUF3570 domain-containing protein [Sulfurovum sp.]|nr:DUF3570 domain-containing protein [Sulfurovum sp.]